uniref:phosphoenolpyruvate carboxykinase (ATP) n=1 Tax=Leptocylindrus danicus TaxID=163516 RepID=A0A7S2PJ41_9STRA|mmetsp:Transcript_34271/g.49797  ORF Transcript_34271/g.49797 Transcript_34271/m.49797 type:complete len:629 (+) Transcript_34271:154-2040(+)|eukprot:CAMPEP_0116020656 /NCGR_PEP_ID=MMETSP0321-20121206/9926_1 /TAXON_ID=163516 /ORGANISM="Leptocylindrus danicus var. danicus, Strain B650" /LENGTH=628 /DNA_ID=CAMNT_0003491387 /DNA_START=154 /DNA_END=2040 /DNA_ORIENTATION=+
MLLVHASKAILRNSSRLAIRKTLTPATVLATTERLFHAAQVTADPKKFHASAPDARRWKSSARPTASSYAQEEQETRDAYNIAQHLKGASACKQAGIDGLGITQPSTIYRNLTFQELFQHEVQNREGEVANAEYGDTFMIDTGKFTGRSPKDKWIVKNIGSESDQNVDWGSVNQPVKPEVFDELYEKAIQHMNGVDKLYVFDGFCGANPSSQRKVRFVHEMAWQQHFVTNMFIRPENSKQIEDFEPDFTVINACSQVNEDWERHGLNSDVAVAFNIEKKVAVIFGTWYGGENKKGIFSLMNYWLPMATPAQLPMHCSANVGKRGDSALFFGLSGTGKTTLSADPHRYLIGDDEHGWDEEGVFNFEGGCYAKTINLSEETEPDIYRAIHTDAMLENVKLVEEGDKLIPDYFDVSKTQNGRVSYPIHHIHNYYKPQRAGHPENVIFLTCDAFGVLPPVSKLTKGQAMYHFLSGYTAKVAGTERGIKEPQATFSACFGAAFLTLCPTRYADLLAQKMEQHGAHAYLVNTGWTGGPYGVGHRMSIKDTRACIDAILDGSIQNVNFEQESVFGLHIPTELPHVDSKVLNPRNAWDNKEEFDAALKKLAGMYADNFKQYQGKGSEDYTQYGPKV